MLHPLIRKMERMSALSDEEKSAIEDACSRVRTFGPDEDIVHHGERPSDCNLILDGFACRYKLLHEGKRQIMSFQIAGDICDLQSFVLGVMDHHIGTLTRCTVALIPHRTLLEITERYPRVARALWTDTLIEASVFSEWLTSLGRRPAYQRIAHLICEVMVRLDAVGLVDNGSFAWPVTQAEIGDALGLSTVHVNRVLQQLRGDGLITFRGNTLLIHDWDALKKAGDFNPDYLHLGRPE
jgi:CRP-like cAMP-binding protein